MSAECNKCGHDMGYGPMGVPVCDWCRLRSALERAEASAKRAWHERDQAVQHAAKHENAKDAIARRNEAEQYKAELEAAREQITEMWHGEHYEHLHDALGMTWDQYKAWVER